MQNNFTREEIEDSDLELVKQSYEKDGYIFLPKFLEDDSLFLDYLQDIKKLFSRFYKREKININKSYDEILNYVIEKEATIGKMVCNFGTQPNQFMSGNVLKYHPLFLKIVKKLYGNDTLIGVPASGDTLHIFPYTDGFKKYFLPIHQDYPYLMQSPTQLTILIGLTEYRPGIGGVKIYGGSHQLGIRPTTKNKDGHFQSIVTDEELNTYGCQEFMLDRGDVVFFHSLMLHQSVHNTSKYCRSSQLFRFSKLNEPAAKYDNYLSTHYSRNSSDFINKKNKFWVEPQ